MHCDWGQNLVPHQKFVVVQLLSRVRLFVTAWTAACWASLSFTISWSLLKLMFIKSVMPSNHLVLCCPLFLLPSIFPSIRVFSNESALCIRWSKYWSFSISPSNEYSGLISFRMDWLDLLEGLSRVLSNTTVEKHQFFGVQPSLWSQNCCCCCCVASVVSDSVQPQRWQPTRLPCPWDSLGKNTGVVCHFLLQVQKLASPNSWNLWTLPYMAESLQMWLS